MMAMIDNGMHNDDDINNWDVNKSWREAIK